MLSICCDACLDFCAIVLVGNICEVHGGVGKKASARCQTILRYVYDMICARWLYADCV